MNRAFAAVCLLLIVGCEGATDSVGDDEQRAILSGALEAIRVADGFAILPLDTKLLPVHPEGGLLPPGSTEHAAVPASPLLRELAASNPRIEGIEPSDIPSADLVVSVGVPVRTTDTSADVYAAVAEPAKAHVTYWIYSMVRGDDGTWRLDKRDLINVEG